MTEHDDCVGRILSKKKKAGIPINAQAMAIAISECDKKSKMAEYEMFQSIPITYQIIDLK